MPSSTELESADSPQVLSTDAPAPTRKIAPVPKEDNADDRELDGSASSVAEVKPLTKDERQKRKHERKVEGKKIDFSFKLVGGLLFAIVVVTLVGHASPAAGGQGSYITDFLELGKVVILTALGFAFGKTQS